MTPPSGCDDHGDHRPKHADWGYDRASRGPTSLEPWTKTFELGVGVGFATLGTRNTFDNDCIVAVDKTTRN